MSGWDEDDWGTDELPAPEAPELSGAVDAALPPQVVNALVVESVRKAMRERLASITASIGLATRQSGETAADLLKRTDQAMYRAKNGGRNRVCRA